MRIPLVAVVGSGSAHAALQEHARRVGRAIADSGVGLVCGGRDGVMAAAAEGALAAGGRTVGILPGASAEETPANPHIEVAIYTGLGQARNQILVLSADAVLGIGGSWGTLTEIGLALKHRIPVVLQRSWQLTRPDGEEDPRLLSADNPQHAVDLALQAAREKGDP